VKLNLIGKKTEDGKVLKDIDDVLSYILEEGKIALVPFYAFGASKDSPCFRLSVGTCSKEEAKLAAEILKETIEKLK
jgi:aspartate aminotransferase